MNYSPVKLDGQWLMALENYIFSMNMNAAKFSINLKRSWFLIRVSALKAISILKNKKLNCRIVGLSETDLVTTVVLHFMWRFWHEQLTIEASSWTCFRIPSNSRIIGEILKQVQDDVPIMVQDYHAWCRVTIAVIRHYSSKSISVQNLQITYMK